MLKQIVAPTQDVIDYILSLASAKVFACIEGEHDDEIIKDLIRAAISEAEEVTNRQFATATYELTLSNLTQNLKLPKNPIQEVSKVEYMDQDGVYQVLEPTSYYLHEELEVGVLVFEKLPAIKNHKQAVKITFNCGYKTAEEFPPMLRQWLRVRVNTLYEHREGITFSNVKKLDHVDSVLDRHRIRPM